MKKIFFLVLIIRASFFAVDVYSQDFGFGTADSGTDSTADGAGFGFGSDAYPSVPEAGSVSPIKISGEVSAELKAFFDEMSGVEKIKNIRAGNIFKGNLDFSVSGTVLDVFVGLKLTPVFDLASSPVSLGEAYGRAYFGPVTFEAGLRKVSWGRADSFGPLDVVNPLDYSDLSLLSDPQSMKIPRPMLRASWVLGSFSKLEAVFVPWFEAHKFALSGRWAPGEITVIKNELIPEISAGLMHGLGQYPLPSDFLDNVSTALYNWQGGFKIEDHYNDHDPALRSAQAGLRFTTTVASADLGFQYYFGRLPRPVYSIDYDDFIASVITLPPISSHEDVKTSLIRVTTAYNYFHQIGADVAAVIAGFNTRAELGANITKDMDGTDGEVYNPALVYSLGFDRDLFFGINLNLQGNGDILLFRDNIKENPFDIEAGRELTSTRLTGILSRKFLMDELELKLTALWGIEDKDFMIRPSVAWTKNDLRAELRAGFFLGDKKGELGQYYKNNYISALVSFNF